MRKIKLKKDKKFNYGYSDGIDIDEILDEDEDYNEFTDEEYKERYENWKRKYNLSEDDVKRIFLTPKPKSIFELMARVDKYEKNH